MKTEFFYDNKLEGRSIVASSDFVKQNYSLEEFLSSQNQSIDKEYVFFANSWENYYFVIANQNLQFESNKIEKRQIVVFLSENTSKDYIKYLVSKKISFICSGKENIDVNRCFEIVNQTLVCPSCVVLGKILL